MGCVGSAAEHALGGGRGVILINFRKRRYLITRVANNKLIIRLITALIRLITALIRLITRIRCLVVLITS